MAVAVAEVMVGPRNHKGSSNRPIPIESLYLCRMAFWLEAAQRLAPQYAALYARSIREPDTFWKEIAEILTWARFPTKISHFAIHHPTNPTDKPHVDIRWYEDGLLNAAYNTVGRHARSQPDRVAFYWEPDHPDTPGRRITYAELEKEVHHAAGILRHLGIQKGDRVAIYLPMIPETIAAMLACAQMGAIHTVVFAGFSTEALRSRLLDSQAKLLITTEESPRGGKVTPLYQQAIASAEGTAVEHILVIDTPEKLFAPPAAHHHSYQALKATIPPYTDYPPMQAEDPLFILYTSGSTGKPKGLLHTTGGYLVYTAYTFRLVFDYKPEDVYFCAADVGWITGHSYLVYGPLSNGATQVLFQGTPTYPTPGRLWQIVDKYGVSILYTSPTAIRALMREGDRWVHQSRRDRLCLLGSVGEPINPEAWRWYHDVVGKGQCPIVDTWWQTETGGISISPLPALHNVQKPGSATYPLPGIQPVLLTPEGQELSSPGEGILALKGSWPGQGRTLWGDPQRFYYEVYFAPYPGYYYTGDGARIDEDGCFWIYGRIDDVLKVAGHRLGTADIESALVAHPTVAEAAVVGFPHPIKGEGIYAFVVLQKDTPPPTEAELIETVRQQVGPIAKPDVIHIAPDLPKTRSGKIMRRILRKIATGERDFGDTSTLADPAVVEVLWEGRRPLPG
jgi:acetyl-CoA synthetase